MRKQKGEVACLEARQVGNGSLEMKTTGPDSECRSFQGICFSVLRSLPFAGFIPAKNEHPLSYPGLRMLKCYIVGRPLKS